MSSQKRKSGASVGYLQLLRQNPAFRTLWAGQIVSLLGDWFNLIASASLIAILTQSGVAVGGLFVVRMLGPFLVSPFSGVVADRYNRKYILILTDILRGFAVLGFLLVRQPEHVWLIYAITAFQTALQGFFFPARNAILPDITKPNELGAANALSSATWSVMLSLGSALGGLFSGIWGIYPAFVLDAVTFFVSAVILSRMVYEPPIELRESDKSILAGFRQYIDGLIYLRQHLDILAISLHKGANSLFVVGIYQVTQVAIAERYFPIGEGGSISLGFIYVATGIGTGLGPIIARRFTGDRDRALRIAITVGYLFATIGLLVASTLSSFPIFLLGSFLRGLGGGIVWVLATQLLLQLVPVEVRGRVFSTEFALHTLMGAISSGMAGTLLDTTFTESSLLMFMAVLLLIPISLWSLWIMFGKHQRPIISAAN